MNNTLPLLGTELIELRHALHRAPELSGQEEATSALIAGWMEEAGAEVVTGLGGHGLAAIFRGAAPGPRVMLRCELDALPIDEVPRGDWSSCHQHVGHLCGHDGHMTWLLGVAQRLARRPVARGEVVLLFQPAEETGEGARAVVRTKAFETIKPDFLYACHNLPGRPLGEVSVRDDAFTCASRGMIVRLSGLCAHAAHPENGRSPAMAMCRIMQGLSRLPLQFADETGLAMVTLVHARLGEVAFGTAPGDVEVMATLRTESNDMMKALAEAAVSLARSEAEEDHLGIEVDWCDAFEATWNSAEANAVIRRVAAQVEQPCHELDQAHRWSEDFGVLGRECHAAMFTLGAGEALPGLHHPRYDFPDDLILPGVALFEGLVRHHLNGA
ncbi:amidohydrolase [Cobetia sp. 10Alg 146]|uniref:amidohydrolase n=1 Tax=Cobetia sp. 10Alg 146 TaxID=3040019 RepID=UPI00244C9E3D|nr:amidohydrolase [Cobetia sp. 10Alg 146]MDH2290905.1 amidohydrolase [Cobetia sp. 10Alg 146]